MTQETSQLSLKEQFERDGYIVARKVFPDQEIKDYIKVLQELSGENNKKWTVPDGLVKRQEFWPAIFNPIILTNVEAVLGDGIKFLSHNDLHVGYSSVSWHRDSVNRTYGLGPEWDDSLEPFQICRVGIYLQDAKNKFKLGLIPGSHRPMDHYSEEEHKKIEKLSSGVANAVRVVSGLDWLKDRATWVETEPGDCIIFDPRVIHTGSKFDEVKYSFFMAYGVPNVHFHNYYYYYHRLRIDLGYQDIPADLIEQLKEHDLYVDPELGEREIEGAWVPSKSFNVLAKQFKKIPKAFQ